MRKKPIPAPDVPVAPLDSDDQLALAAYNQNSETFRALNALMWQIPLIAMTLTGGLWFGVSTIPKDGGLAMLRPALLAIAAVGDVLLIVVLERLRHIIGEYLAWLKAAHPRGHVAATGNRWWNNSRTVKLCFQLMLGFAATVSFVLLTATMVTALQNEPSKASPQAVVAWYDAHARELADGYEGLDAAEAHPKLFEMLGDARGLCVLDVGAGTGRDAAALAHRGHHVTAVEASKKMLRLARALHPGHDVLWLEDAMPSLAKVKGAYDLVLLSAVWMHVPPDQREAAFSRLTDLTAPHGRIYMTLRLGAGDVNRAMWSVSVDEVHRLAAARGMVVTDLGKQPDLLGRDDVSWQTLVVSRGA